MILYLALWGRFASEIPAFFDDGASYSMAFALNEGAEFFEGIVDNRPPLLVHLVAAAFRVARSVTFVKWLSVAIFALLLVLVFQVVRNVTRRAELGCVATTILVTSWPLRHYGIVEISLSYWQAMMSLAALVVLMTALGGRYGTGARTGSHRDAAYGLVALSGVLWAFAFCIKQQAVILLPALVCLSLFYQRPETRLRDGLRTLLVFAIGATGGLFPLYYWTLGNADLSETYRYVVLSNLARNARVPYDHAWWLTKADVLHSMILSSVRIPALMCVVIATLALGIRWAGAWSGRAHADGHTGAVAAEGSNRSPDTRRILAWVVAASIWVGGVIGFYFVNVLAQSHYLLELPLVVGLLFPLTLIRWRGYSRTAVFAANILLLSAVTIWHGAIRHPIDASLYARAKMHKRTADLIERNSGTADRLLVFGNPILYYQAARQPASRFLFFVDVWTTPLMVEEYGNAIFESLEAESTRIVVLPDKVRGQMPDALRSMLEQKVRTSFRELAVEDDGVASGRVTIYIRKVGGDRAQS